MSCQLTDNLTSVSWNELPNDRRCFLLLDDEESISEEDALRISRLTYKSSLQFWERIYPSIPKSWSQFPIQENLVINDENWNTDEGIQSVRQWLHDLGIPYSTDIYLIYEENRIVLTTWKIFLKYWDSFSWSVGVSLLVMDDSRQWALEVHHEDAFNFGSYAKQL